MNKKVTDILLRKGSHITSVPPSATVLQALKIMADQNIGSVMVMENGKYLGLMTERDYSRKVILQGHSSSDTLVGEIMTDDLPRVTPNDSVEYCMQLMSDKNIRYLPGQAGYRRRHRLASCPLLRDYRSLLAWATS